MFISESEINVAKNNNEANNFTTRVLVTKRMHTQLHAVELYITWLRFHQSQSVSYTTVSVNSPCTLGGGLAKANTTQNITCPIYLLLQGI